MIAFKILQSFLSRKIRIQLFCFCNMWNQNWIDLEWSLWLWIQKMPMHAFWNLTSCIHVIISILQTKIICIYAMSLVRNDWYKLYLLLQLFIMQLMTEHWFLIPSNSLQVMRSQRGWVVENLGGLRNCKSFKRHNEHKFTVDRLFDEDSSEHEVYESTAIPSVVSVLIVSILQYLHMEPLIVE